MKTFLVSVVSAITFSADALASEGISSPYTDSVRDIDLGINSFDGTLDIIGMEVMNSATDITFTLSLNGNLSTADWGTFMIGISTGSTASTNNGNGWNRPIQLNSPIGGMDFWIGSWVNSGGGSQIWSFNGVSWANQGALPGYSFSAGATSTITYTLALTSLGLAVDDIFYFDAYSSAAPSIDSAVDALANPNVAISSWGQTYTSSATADGGKGLNSYTVIPEPSTLALIGLTAAGLISFAFRRRARK